MNPKSKAEAMVKRYETLLNYDLVSDLQWHNPMDSDRNRRIRKDAKKCAIAAVDFIIEQNDVWIMQCGKGTNNFLYEVKKEIERL